jgi:hypothetical protein
MTLYVEEQSTAGTLSLRWDLTDFLPYLLELNFYTGPRGGSTDLYMGVLRRAPMLPQLKKCMPVQLCRAWY